MARVAGDLVRLRGYKSVYGLASKFMRDARLRTVFSFHPLLIGGSPFRATAIYCLIPFLEQRFGVHFVMGGTGRLVTGLVDLIAGQGGAVRCGESVESIVVEDGVARGVRLASGARIPADIVVSNADSAWTYRNLVPAGARRRWTNRKLDRARYSMGLFVWYFGTRRRYPEVGHHTILLGPRYRELLADIFQRKRLADDFSLYLHRPTATDPSLAPAGCDAFYVLSPVPNLLGGQDWAAEAEPYRRRIAGALEASILPGLGGAIATSRVTTPLEFQNRLNSCHGAAFGLEPILTQSAWFRPHNRSEDIRNLFLVGAGTHPGAGLPGVLSSARVLDKVAPDVSAFA
jgi:phytoene desaturase